MASRISLPRRQERLTVSRICPEYKTWIGDAGYPHTEAMRVTERFRRLNFGSMEVDFTFEDPEAFTQPWSEVAKFRLLSDTEVMEQVCENEKDAPHMVGK